ncbi:MAG TPA: hypothetical protein VES59_08400 [Bacteroidota bacterium]|nr:hypothetical protein [Bacteroidota bacterium]
MNFRTIVLGASSILISAALGDAQTQRQPVFNHPLTTFRDLSGSRGGGISAPAAGPETLRILTAMVAFQEDSDPRTTGSGSFDTTTPTKNLLDPPPHDSAYVQNHLAFAANYFRKVSDGRLIVTGEVLGPVYRLPYPMQHYSPTRSSANNVEIGLLMRDSWHLIDSVTPGISFGKYQVFLLVHAGAGRDIDLTSIYGFDPTPFDIPSIYLNLASLKKMFGNSYDGVPVAGGTFLIPNSIILPETESRILESAVGSSLLQLGINGLLAASVGSHLGLPDLFDTKTGASGIGRFGLMDGQSIFSWSGLFPPEPSAWERAFLGWLQPIAVTGGNAVYALPAVTLPQDSVYRVLISAKEYFLVENRNRDANRDGATVTMVRNGQPVVRTWSRDTVGFNAFNPDSLYGVVTDVDEFDWSLPGGVSARTGELFDGGILIWHVDENVIEANYDADAVNGDPDRRGVNLEEADGSQDIGQTYGLISPGAGSESGTVLDFWYAGNKAPLRLQSNEFTPTSHPSSLSNDHAESHVYIREFSARAPRMTARIQVGDNQVELVPGFPKNVGRIFGRNSITAVDLFTGGTGAILVATSGLTPNSLQPGRIVPGSTALPYVYGWKSDGGPIGQFFSSGRIAQASGLGTCNTFTGKPVAGDFNRDNVPDLAVTGLFRFINDPIPASIAVGWRAQDNNNDSLADQAFLVAEAPGPQITTSLAAGDTDLAFGTRNNDIVFLSGSGNFDSLQQLSPGDTSSIVGVSRWSRGDTVVAVSASGTVGIVTPRGVVIKRSFAHPMSSPAVAGTISSGIGRRIVFATTDGYVYSVDGSLKTADRFPVSTGGEILNACALADIDGDGVKDIVVFSGRKVFAYNAVGSVLDNFPIIAPSSKSLLTSPIIADLNGDGRPDIVGVTQEGLVFAYDRSGTMLPGFPILGGVNAGSTPAAFYIPSGCLSCSDIGLAVASDDGNVYAWRTGTVVTGPSSPPEQPWPQYLHDARNSGLSDTLLYQPAQNGEFFPASRAYNWPNPVDKAHGYKTHIRYYVKNPANVHIRIFDLAGDQVTEFDGPGAGGLDNEVDWSVDNIQSGIYFARIEAVGSGGGGSAVIKIAVVK